MERSITHERKEIKGGGGGVVFMVARLRGARALISIRPDGSRTARNTFDVNNHDGLKEKRKRAPTLLYG